MKKSHKFTIKGATLALLLSLAGCGGTTSDNSQILKKINSVDLVESSLKLDYLTNETVDLSTGKVYVSYTDGETKEFNLDPSMIGEIENGEGTHSVLISFVLDDFTYDFTTKYTIYETQSELDFALKAKALPPINLLTLDDVENVIDLCSEFEALQNSEKSFLTANIGVVIDALNHVETALIDIYFADRKDDLKVFYETLNKAAYRDADFESIEILYNTFADSTFTSLKDVKVSYEEAVANINKVNRKAIPLKTYKADSIAFLKEFLITKFYSVSGEGTNWVVEETPLDLYENELMKEPMDTVFASINAAGSVDEVDILYKQGYEVIQQNFTAAYADDAIANLNQLYLSIKSMVATDLARYEGDTMDLPGMFENITTDYLNDNRWWIPEPFRIKTLLEEGGALLKAAPVAKATTLYDELALEIARATLMKNLEMVYFINRIFNKAYDTNNGYYWGVISDRWGAGTDRQLIYRGPLTAYRNNLYGTSDSNPIRFCSKFYGENEAETTIQGSINAFWNMIAAIAPDPLAVSSTDIKAVPAKTQYLVGEPLDLTGGVIAVNYNDLTFEDVSMTVEMADTTTFDMSKIGSQVAVLRFKDPKLGTDVSVEIEFVVLSGDPRYDVIVQDVNELSDPLTASDIPLIQDILKLIDDLGADKDSFTTTFQSEMSKLNNAQLKLIKDYYGEKLATYTRDFETLNLSSYGSNKSNVENLFTTLNESIKAATTFKEVDDAFDSYDSDFAGYSLETANLAAFKETTIQSLNQICSVKLNKFSGTFYNVRMDEISKSLLEDTDIKALLDPVVGSINGAASVEAVTTIFNENVDNLLDLVISKYQVLATENAKQSILDIREAISEIWVSVGEDNITVAGESGSDFSTNYIEDMGGYYVWYTPLAYHTDIIYNGLSVNGNVTTKTALYDNYMFCLWDASRAALYRNLFTMFFYNTEKGNPMLGTMWNTLFFCDGTFTYDGCIEAYNGQVFEENNFRLWRWGWHITDRTTTFEDLIYHYNYDMMLFMNVNPEA